MNSIKLLILAAGLLAVAACSAPEPAAPPPPTVAVAAPLKRSITDWDDYVGRFEAIEDVEVLPRVSGNVTRIAFREGLTVGKGQVLYEIDPRPFRAALAQAEAEVARARANAAVARSELARAETLLPDAAISKELYEQKRAAARAADAAVAAARASAEARQLDLSFTQVRAPVAGRVSDRRASLGDYVTAGQTVLTRVVSVDPIWFTFDGAESFYLKYIRQDASGERKSSRYAPNPVEIQLADEEGYRWKGRMVFVDNALDPRSGTIKARAEVANPSGFLVPGLFGRARLLGSGAYDGLLVPDEAVITDQTRRAVFVLGKDNKVEMRNVELGPMVEGLRAVRSGLKPTDKVVLDGLARLQPGAVVTPKQGAIRPRAKNAAPVALPVSAPPAAEAKSQ
ncbi:efflux RND transporter periplasmic adaptor subunit [Erythrobacter sp. WG]|uniref:efflux RND transporter periplasmic adaptor subunit n=1 Tax=Erythrobacter sp. WG TaxID=2985510 RepID=UPI00227121D2|nr:efflux RND transporter periplasmic adaptor subunit [Erythrobacter sp. WG]MCX9145947.1 efflux RND transporter periplasmic adaptor subunit [Erythrobacter sp. WG]